MISSQLLVKHFLLLDTAGFKLMNFGVVHMRRASTKVFDNKIRERTAWRVIQCSDVWCVFGNLCDKQYNLTSRTTKQKHSTTRINDYDYIYVTCKPSYSPTADGRTLLPVEVGTVSHVPWCRISSIRSKTFQANQASFHPHTRTMPRERSRVTASMSS